MWNLPAFIARFILFIIFVNILHFQFYTIYKEFNYNEIANIGEGHLLAVKNEIMKKN